MINVIVFLTVPAIKSLKVMISASKSGMAREVYFNKDTASMTMIRASRHIQNLLNMYN